MVTGCSRRLDQSSARPGCRRCQRPHDDAVYNGKMCALGQPQRVLGGSNDLFRVVNRVVRSSEAAREGPGLQHTGGLAGPKGMAAEAGTAPHKRNRPRLESTAPNVACGLVISGGSQCPQEPPRIRCFLMLRPQMECVVRYEAKSHLAVSSNRNHANNLVGFIGGAAADRIILDFRSAQFLSTNSGINGNLACQMARNSAHQVEPMAHGCIAGHRGRVGIRNKIADLRFTQQGKIEVPIISKLLDKSSPIVVLRRRRNDTPSKFHFSLFSRSILYGSS